MHQRTYFRSDASSRASTCRLGGTALERLEPRLALDVALADGQVLFASELVDPINVQSADLDGDGRSDMVAQSKFDQAIVWFRNLGDEGFARPQPIASPIKRFPIPVAADGVPAQASLPDIHVWDVDTDGDLDLVVAWWMDIEPQPNIDSFLGEVAWLENVDGTGTTWRKHVVGTTNPVAQPAEKSYVRTARGDFSGDGRDDLAVLWTEVENEIYPYTLRAELSWFAARSDGAGFKDESPLAEIPFTPFLSELDAADVDVDGDLDLILILETSHHVSQPPATPTEIVWFENDPAAGGLQDAAVLLTTDDYFASTAPVDLDEDGDSDLLVEVWRDDYPHRVIGWHENVAGQFAADLQVITSIHDGYNSVPSSVLTRGDVDGDGRQDVIVAGAGNNGASGIGWYAFDAHAGRFVLRSALPALTAPRSEWKFIATTDVDRDGDLDLVASYVESDYETAEAETALYWWEHLDGDGHFGLPQFLTLFEGEWRYALTRDAEGDLLIGWSTTPLDAIATLKPLPPDGSEGLSWRLMHALQSSGFEEAWLVTAADVHRDGWVDLIAAAPPYGSHQRLLYARDVRAGIHERELPLDPPCFYLSLKIADLVPGGPAELLYTTYHEVGWQYDVNGGRPIFRTDDRVDAAAAGDIDGDGDEDVLVAVRAASPNVDSVILMIENRGTTPGYDIDFAVPRVLITAEARELNVGDVDGDGDLDIYSERSVWLNADGRGRLEPLIAFADSAYTIAAADFDGDGDLDLLRRAFGPLYLVEYDQRSEIYSPPRTIPWPAHAAGEGGFAGMDLDADGDLDIVGLTTEGYWLANTNGAGTFAPAESLPIQIASRTRSAARGGPPTVQPVDWDADGDPDLIVTGWADGQTKVVLYVNESTISIPASGDFDANGHVSQADLDLVLTNWGRDRADLPGGWIGEPPRGAIDQTELDAVLMNWGSTAGALSNSSAQPATTLKVPATPSLAAKSKQSKDRYEINDAALEDSISILETFGLREAISMGETPRLRTVRAQRNGI